MTSLFGINKSLNINCNIKEEKIEINKTPQKKIKIENHIKDLENTLKLNQDYINNIILISPINQKNKKKLIKTLENIKLLFNQKKYYRKDSVDISSKILINKQIIEEIKRRNNENIIYQNDKLSNCQANVNKKDVLIKNILKKFNELEIFIQRKSKLEENVEKYGKWRNFTVIPFMKKNEYFCKKLKFYKINTSNIEHRLNELTSETNFLKQSKAIKINFDQNNKNKIIFDNFNLIRNYYININALKEKEVELIHIWNNSIIGKKYCQRKKIINDTIFESKINENEKNIFEKDVSINNNKKDTNNKKDIENEFLFTINEIEDKDLKEFEVNNNFWLDSEPEEI